jgi:hypothetical protein
MANQQEKHYHLENGTVSMKKKLNKLGVENSLWNNIRAKSGSGKKPTAEMLKQEKKIVAKEKKKK